MKRKTVADNKQKSIKILYVAHERKLGGATRSLIALIEEMDKAGHQICVIVPTANSPLAGELRKRGVEYIPCFFAWWMYPQSWNNFLKLSFKMLYHIEGIQIFFVIGALKRRGFFPDIVHSNSSVTDFGGRLAKRLHCKHVWHVREYGDVDYDLAYMSSRKATWSCMNEISDRILFISKDVYNYFSDVLEKEKSEVIYNGIAQSYRIDDKAQNEKTEFVLASNINRSKNHMLVIKAAKILVEKGYSNFHISIAGASSIVKDSKKYEEELKCYVKEAKLEQYVSFVGKIDDMVLFRKHADVEIVPSKREAFGRVTVEAMLSRMPVIASDSGANGEIVEDGVTGAIFCNDMEMDLADKMTIYIDNPNLIKEHGKNAVSRAEELFLASRNAKEINRVYSELLL